MDAFWSSIRSASGWAWALAEIKRSPGRIAERGERWGESPLHWACMGHIEASSELLAADPALIFVKDFEGRLPLDWAMEKVYFLREELETAPHSDIGKFQKMADDAVSCIHFCVNYASTLSEPQPCMSPDRSVQIGLAAGELALAMIAQEMLPDSPSESIWLGGLAGYWKNETAVDGYVEFLAENFGITGRDKVFDKFPIRHVYELWLAKRITNERARWFQSNWGQFDKDWSPSVDHGSNHRGLADWVHATR